MLLLEPFGELADRCRLPGPVHAREHDHERAGRRNDQRSLELLDERNQRIAQNAAGTGVRARPAIAHLQIVEEMRRRSDADIRHEQCRLELIERLLVKLATRENAGQRAREPVA